MITFHAPTLADKPWLDERSARARLRACEYNFVNIYLWQSVYCQQVCDLNGFALIRVCGVAGEAYLYPMGDGDMAAAVETLAADAAARGTPLRLVCVPIEGKALLERLFPGRFAFSSDRDGSDYLYLAIRLAEVAGKKLHNKRTHINRFVQTNPDWSFEPITPANLGDCRAVDAAWYRENLAEGESVRWEADLLAQAFDEFSALGLEGGLLRAGGGRPVAFALGRHMAGDTYDIHFEKALESYAGAYAMINREFARLIRARHPDVVYLNREDDLGLPGLRRSKESYYPDLMVEKWTAEEIR
ncbi:MAG TPA: phosphatidylglycerol lysyltransferase domain-containing protein [Oscillospiraceae bacterium]|nr:phosphatidylglycerol lysyltransferase domain-containing protein [Oscillospiraceae bacterium]